MFNRMFKGRGTWFATLLFVAICLAPGVATGAKADGQPASTSTAVEPGAEVPALDERFTRPPDQMSLPAIPSDPVETLITATNAHSASLGFPVDHGPSIRDAGLSEEFAGRVALLMQAVLDCDGADAEAKRLECVAAANDAAAGVSQAKGEPFSNDVQVQGTSSGDVEAWPSLYIDEDGGNDYYVHDYSVLIDKGGNDTYDNNSGSNLQDHIRGPEGSAAPLKADAIGCEHAHMSRVAPVGSIAPVFDCVSARQVVFIDQKGDDVYGVFKPPRMEDHNPLPDQLDRRVDGECTGDPVIRRIVLQGSGFQGNGLLMDESGNDRYRGKTIAQGTGHIGVGILRDLGGGEDDYLAIRNSQGFALFASDGGGVASALLQDDGGDDRYHTYMPSALDPNANPRLQEPGSGGVVDDTDQCDSLPRQVQGASLFGGTAQLLDENGRDFYEGVPENSQLFLSPGPGVIFRHSSQGFGCDGGVGILEDRGRDADTYIRGPEGRRDGASISETRTDCFAAPGQDVFRDDGPNASDPGPGGGNGGSDCKGKKGKKNGKGKNNGCKK